MNIIDSTETKDGGKIRVLRVTQLDASRLDSNLFQKFQNELKSSLEVDETFSKLLRYLEPELNAALRYIIWRLSILQNGVTVGQNMYNTEYLSTGYKVTPKKKLIFGFFVIFVPWMKERYTSFIRLLNSLFNLLNIGCSTHYIEESYKYIDLLLKLLSLLNFLVFLRYGHRANMVEQVLQLDHVFRNKPAPRYIDYAYMGKEMVWHHNTQALAALIPFMNLRKIKNYMLKLVRYWGGEGGVVRDELICQVCGERATNPYSGECKHIFCYYCLLVNMQDDSSYACPACDTLMTQLDPYLMPLKPPVKVAL